MNVRVALNILLVVSIVAALAGGAALMFRDGGSQDGVTITLDEPSASTVGARTEQTTPATIKVYVSGEARRPGVYELPSDARADDALQAAGGPTSNAALELVNLAKKVADEEQLHIPGQSDRGDSGTVANGIPSASAGNAGLGGSGKLDINTATAEEFTALPNIGPSRAAAIVDYREREGPFASVDDLQNVGGIGEKITDSIRDLVEVR